MGSTVAYPLVDFNGLELPQAANFVGRHGFFTDSLVDRISLDAEVGPDFVYG